MFETRTQAKMLHVPYKGGAPAVNDTLAGNVDMLFAVLPEALPHIQAGKLHALGLMNAKRTATLPNTPTMAESGFADLNLSAWVGLFAPAKTPKDVMTKLSGALAKALKQPEVISKLNGVGVSVGSGDAAELAQFLPGEYVRIARLITSAKIKAD